MESPKDEARGAGGYHVLPQGAAEFRALPEPAKGPIIAVAVNEEGDIICTKSDGGDWNSAAGGHVEFYVRPENGVWTFAGYRNYQNGVSHVTLKKGALALLDGHNNSAQCIAIPYIDIPIEPPWEACPLQGEETACTRSGVYTFSVTVDEGVLMEEDKTAACGKGDGNASGTILCISMKNRPAAIYPYVFECPLGGSYHVKLNTVHGSTSLDVGDVEGRIYETVDGVQNQEFSSSSLTGICLAYVVAHEESKFSLQIKETRPGSAVPIFTDLETMIRSAKPGDILAVKHSDIKCDWMNAENLKWPNLPTYCHTAIVTSSWPNFRTVEALDKVSNIQESDRYEYWIDDDGVDGARVALLTVPEGDAAGAVAAAQEIAAQQPPYEISFSLYDHSSFYCSKLVHAAYYLAGTDIRGWDIGLFLPDDLVLSPATKLIGYYETK